MLLRMNSRKDSYALVKREDFAFGFDLSVASLLLIAVKSAGYVTRGANGDKVDSRIQEAPWILLCFFVVLLVIGMLVRKRGWNESQEPTILVGILLPDIFGLASLVFALQWIGNRA